LFACRFRVGLDRDICGLFSSFTALASRRDRTLVTFWPVIIDRCARALRMRNLSK
jgi:hypothetical protein